MEIMVYMMAIGLLFGILGLVGLLLGILVGSAKLVDASFLLNIPMLLLGTPLVLTVTIKAVFLLLFSGVM